MPIILCQTQFEDKIMGIKNDHAFRVVFFQLVRGTLLGSTELIHQSSNSIMKDDIKLLLSLFREEEI